MLRRKEILLQFRAFAFVSCRQVANRSHLKAGVGSPGGMLPEESLRDSERIPPRLCSYFSAPLRLPCPMRISRGMLKLTTTVDAMPSPQRRRDAVDTKELENALAGSPGFILFVNYT